MNLLLDTHAFLWATGETEKLSTVAFEALQNYSNELWVSSVSLFEISTKVRIGKLAVRGPLLSRWQHTLARLNAKLLPLSGVHAVRAGALVVEHRDPFDRLLAAQAIEEGMYLVTRDAAFTQFEGLTLLW